MQKPGQIPYLTPEIRTPLYYDTFIGPKQCDIGRVLCTVKETCVCSM